MNLLSCARSWAGPIDGCFFFHSRLEAISGSLSPAPGPPVRTAILLAPRISTRRRVHVRCDLPARAVASRLSSRGAAFHTEQSRQPTGWSAGIPVASVRGEFARRRLGRGAGLLLRYDHVGTFGACLCGGRERLYAGVCSVKPLRCAATGERHRRVGRQPVPIGRHRVRRTARWSDVPRRRRPSGRWDVWEPRAARRLRV